MAFQHATVGLSVPPSERLPARSVDAVARHSAGVTKSLSVIGQDGVAKIILLVGRDCLHSPVICWWRVHGQMGESWGERNFLMEWLRCRILVRPATSAEDARGTSI